MCSPRTSRTPNTRAGRMLKSIGKKFDIKYTDEQIKTYKEAFDLIDEDGGGTVDMDEISSCLRSLGQDVSESDIRGMIAEVDQDGSGEIDFEEFCYMMNKTEQDQKNSGDIKDREIREALEIFERDGNRYIGRNRFAELLNQTNARLSDDDIAKLVELSEPENGHINFEEFVRKMVIE